MKNRIHCLILYDSRGGKLYKMEKLAAAIAEGIRTVPGAEPLLRRPETVQIQDFLSASAIVLGSPNWEGITARLKESIEKFVAELESRELPENALEGRVGAAFMTGWFPCGGTEATLWQMLHILFVRGLVVIGLPHSEEMRLTGSFYGATAHGELEEVHLSQARLLGTKVARTARALRRANLINLLD
jgi:NAD(P)H dehydrogenase (quinone)